ncbi:MAG: hypothetical protein JRH20_17315, partial [Deltaproteobacteria bacterium]|nr:hypothetical protein [Deltaproteobacteria bacterium]
MISLNKRLVLLLILPHFVGISMGCKAEDPPHVINDRGIPEDLQPPTLDTHAGCEGVPLLPAPVIDGGNVFVATQLSQPIRGLSAQAVRIVAHSSIGNSKVSLVGSGGRFCVEVDLIADSQNSIILTPYSDLGCAGNSTTISVQHHSTAIDAGPPHAPQNVALKALITAEPLSELGPLSSVNDGEETTWARFSFADPNPWGDDCDNYAQILLDLKKTYVLTRFEIHWGPETGVEGADGETHWGEVYSILVSAAESPVAP